MGVKYNCCPRCGSLRIEETTEKKGTTQYKCCDCRSRFGDENEAKGYADLLVRFLVEIKDVLGNKIFLKLTKSIDDYKYYLKIGRSKGYEGDLDSSFWDELAENLFVECSFHKWNESYFGTMGNYGLVWDMEASFERRHTLSAHGCNSFPVYWEKVVSLILPLLEECEGSDTFIHTLLQDKKC